MKFALPFHYEIVWPSDWFWVMLLKLFFALLLTDQIHSSMDQLYAEVEAAPAKKVANDM